MVGGREHQVVPHHVRVDPPGQPLEAGAVLGARSGPEMAEGDGSPWRRAWSRAASTARLTCSADRRNWP